MGPVFAAAVPSLRAECSGEAPDRLRLCARLPCADGDPEMDSWGRLFDFCPWPMTVHFCPVSRNPSPGLGIPGPGLRHNCFKAPAPFPLPFPRFWLRERGRPRKSPDCWGGRGCWGPSCLPQMFLALAKGLRALLIFSSSCGVKSRVRSSSGLFSNRDFPFPPCEQIPALLL